MAATEESHALLVPMKLDAFILNESVCNGGKNQAKIVPINQPNYTFLRLTGKYLQNDILNPADLHFSSPSGCNSRFTDLGSRKPRLSRQGVYLHWMVPRTYRTGVAPPTKDSTGRGDVKDHSATGETGAPVDNTMPLFYDPPSRWLVIRKIDDKDSIKPKGAPIQDVKAWVIESNRKRNFNELPPGTDMEVDVSPFIYAMEEDNDSHIEIEKQGEVFIGLKQDALPRSVTTGDQDKSWRELGDSVPRVKLNLLNSSNQLFADYQPHNNNVFSMVDDLEYFDPEDKIMKTLDQASVSYYVLGWHPETDVDPFSFEKGTKLTRAAKLQSLGMVLNNVDHSDIAAWLNAPGPSDSALICHGAMYNVQWNKSQKPKVVADDFGEHLAKNSPVAVGTTPIDALLAYVSAHKELDQGLVQNLEKSIFALETLLRARDDGVESQRQAADLLTNWNYERAEGGRRFFLAENSGAENAKPTQPSEDQRQTLKSLNESQTLLDSLQRSCRSLRWDLFSLWWQFLSDVNGDKRAATISKGVDSLTRRIASLETQIATRALSITSTKGSKSGSSAKEGVLPHFSLQRDPTLLVGGVKSGWPYDYLDPLKARAWSQAVTDAGFVIDKAWDSIFQNLIPKLPKSIRSAATTLIKEFGRLDPKQATPILSTRMEFPLYHDSLPDGPPDGAWRDRWEGRQPWFPLYLEWEAEYTHISFDEWHLDERSFRKSDAAKLQYNIRTGKVLSSRNANLQGKHMVSGRELILPQPSFSLQAKINQLLDETPQDVLDKKLKEPKRTELRKNVQNLAFLSAPLSGFSDHLVTRVQGSHIKPNNRSPRGPPVPMQAAIRASASAGFHYDALRQIGLESDLTPYGTRLQNPTDGHTLFKPVTHGQFRFTKINIIDKFGQAIHAIEPTAFKAGPEPVYPCISEYYKPQVLDNGEPNIIRPGAKGLCEYVQLAPHINQFARLNSTFVTLKGPDQTPPTVPAWEPCNEWDNPIWGWVMVNYADQGVQVFLPNGVFYREVRFGGPKGTQASDKWLPFAPPTKLDAKASSDIKQLQALVNELQNTPGYLQAFISMITKALKTSPASPSAYAEFLNAAIGKPMALVNIGWSLELAVDPFKNQSTLDKHLPPKTLISAKQTDDVYRFPVKLGDKERLFDGLVGYYTTHHELKGEVNPWKLNKLHTFFTESFDPEAATGDNTLDPLSESTDGDDSDDNAGGAVTGEAAKQPKDPRISIRPGKFPKFKAFYIDPSNETPESYTAKRNSELKVFGTIIDPFVPVNAYSSILPINSLSLPPWTWQEAMNRMTAFLHMGPLLVTKNLPEYDSQYRLQSGYNLGAEGKETTNPVQQMYPNESIALPAVNVADWAWLQPYLHKPTGVAEGSDGIVYMPFSLGKADTRPRFEPAPYTAVEGYLQMRRPVMGPPDQTASAGAK